MTQAVTPGPGSTKKAELDFRDLLSTLQRNKDLSDSVVTSLFQEIDRDANGNLGFDEFNARMTIVNIFVDVLKNRCWQVTSVQHISSSWSRNKPWLRRANMTMAPTWRTMNSV